MTDFDIMRLAEQARKFVTRSSRGKPGLMGDANGNVRVSGKTNRVHIRLRGVDQFAPLEAFNDGAPEIWNMPILVGRTADDEFKVLGLDDSRTRESNSGAPVTSVAPHGHAIGLGMEDPVEALRFLPGLVRINTGSDMTVSVNPFHYLLNGLRTYFPGAVIDLTANIPVTASHWAWVKVGVDKATNTLVAVTGTSQDVLSPLTEAQIAAIAFDDDIQLGAVKVKNGDSVVNDPTSFTDCREWMGGDVSSTQYFLLAGETTDAQLHSGADLIVYSDAGVTEVGRWDGATGNITAPVIIGGTGSGDDLTLKSTSDGTKGLIILGSASAYDEVNDRLGIGTTSPDFVLVVEGGSASGGIAYIHSSGSQTKFYIENSLPSGDPVIVWRKPFEIAWQAGIDNSDGNKWKISSVEDTLWSNLAMTIQTNGLIGIGDSSPDAQLDIQIGSSSRIGLIVQGAASQSANLQEWQSSAGTVLSFFDKDANAVLGEATRQTNAGDLQIGGYWTFKEDTAPTADAGYGKIWTESNNELFFQSGDGQTHLLHGNAFSEIWFHSASTVEVTISTEDAFTQIDSFTVVGHSDDLSNVVGSTSTNNLTLSSIAGGEYGIGYHTSIMATGGADKEMLLVLGITLATPKDITDVTDDTVTPIVITSTAHGLEDGDMVEIVGVLGNTAANGSFIVDSKATDTFEIVALDGSATTGNGNFNEGSPTGDVTIFYPGNMIAHAEVRGTVLDHIAVSGLHVLANSDVLALYVANLDGTTNLTVAAVNLDAFRVGD